MNDTRSLPPKRTLPEQIADQLRREILRGELAPGELIKERDRATALEVSRTPMREAIRILAKEGLVVLRPARSPLVADPSRQDITDAIDVLRALELLSGELACDRATDEEIAGIERIHLRMSTLYDSVDALELFEIDMDFHTSIVRATQNPALMDTHKAFLERLWRARYLSASQRNSRERVLRQHGGIVDGLKARDKVWVQNEIGAHLEALVDNIRHKFRSEETRSDEAGQRTVGRS